MKICIVSDSHDNIPNIDTMLEYCKKEQIPFMLHCGDLCAPSVIKYLAEHFSGQIWWIEGNVHGELDRMAALSQDFPQVHYLGEEGSPQIPGVGLKIYMTHYPDVAERIAREENYDFIFYGHNHKPWEETKGKTKLVNPGTLAGMFNKATFAVLDTETQKLELKLLELL
ncbi:MAG: metallophosphoesterase family protein [Candidatus Komeilibacteria bacterium]|nr:metallophosphoesterase family protein [Candidatus Komeilibacteria bacterium]